jgi:hypothetical protein
LCKNNIIVSTLNIDSYGTNGPFGTISIKLRIGRIGTNLLILPFLSTGAIDKNGLNPTRPINGKHGLTLRFDASDTFVEKRRKLRIPMTATGGTIDTAGKTVTMPKIVPNDRTGAIATNQIFVWTPLKAKTVQKRINGRIGRNGTHGRFLINVSIRTASLSRKFIIVVTIVIPYIIGPHDRSVAIPITALTVKTSVIRTIVVSSFFVLCRLSGHIKVYAFLADCQENFPIILSSQPSF